MPGKEGDRGPQIAPSSSHSGQSRPSFSCLPACLVIRTSVYHHVLFREPGPGLNTLLGNMKASFLGIPRELRLDVYRYLLHAPLQPTFEFSRFRAVNKAAILRVNKQICMEAQVVLYDESIWILFTLEVRYHNPVGLFDCMFNGQNTWITSCSRLDTFTSPRFYPTMAIEMKWCPIEMQYSCTTLWHRSFLISSSAIWLLIDHLYFRWISPELALLRLWLRAPRQYNSRYERNIERLLIGPLGILDGCKHTTYVHDNPRCATLLSRLSQIIAAPATPAKVLNWTWHFYRLSSEAIRNEDQLALQYWCELGTKYVSKSFQLMFTSAKQAELETVQVLNARLKFQLLHVLLNQTV